MSSEQKFRLPILQKSTAASLDALLALPATPALPDDLPKVERRSAGSGPVRTSSYVIYVDLPDAREEMLLVHAYTGAYDRVSRRTATYVRSLEPRHAPRPLYGEWSPEPPCPAGEVALPSEETLARLHKRGYLTRMTSEEEEAYFCHIAGTLHQISLRQRPAYVLMPTYQCNLRCAYCFQDHMRTDPSYSHLLRTMTRDMIDRIFKGMAFIESVHSLPEGSQGRAITLFGGEPLLRESRPIIEYILQRAKESPDPFIAAISNATELDAYRDLLGPQGIRAIQITLDGPPDEHDRRRIYADGSGSFARIADNISMALDCGTAISLRMNIDRQNIAHLPQLADEFVRRGWTQYSLFSSYVAPVHAANENVNAKSTFDSWELTEAVKALEVEHPVVSHIGSHDRSMTDQARQLFDKRHDPLPGFKANFCGAHNTMYVIDAFGDIYACWERTGDPSLRVGRIVESGEVQMNSGLMHLWRSRSVISNSVCRKCRYATYCGGGCAILAEADHGTLFANHCDGFAKRFRASIATAYLEFELGVRREPQATPICDM